MLAQNFLSHDVLGITAAELSALIKVLGMFERGEIEPRQFDMRNVDSECGTAHCIGGWAATVMNDYTIIDRVSPFIGEGGLRELFYPSWCHKLNRDAYGATVAQASHALRNYLTTGEPRWEEALAA